MPNIFRSNTFTKSVTVILILLISITSGIHRALLSLLYRELTGTGFGDQLLNNTTGAPLEVWITLALSLAPFGLAKSIADWIGGLRSDRSSAISVMKIAGIFSVMGVLTVVLSIAISYYSLGIISGMLLGLATGFFGITEGLFYVGGTIRLTNLFSNRSRGFSVGLMESSVYSGYTLGAILTGILSTNNIDILTPYLFGIVISLFVFFVSLTQKSVTEKMNEKELKSKQLRQKYSLRLFIRRPRVFTIFASAHVGKFADAFVWILPLFLTSKLFIQTSNSSLTPDYLLISLIISIYTASWAFMMLISSRISDIFGRKWLVFYGFCLTALGLLGVAILPLPGFTNPEYLLLSSAILGIGTGMFYPILTIMAIDVVVRPVQGEMIGLLRSIRDLGYFTAPFIVCFLAWGFGGRLRDLENVGIIISFLLFFSAIFQLILLRESHPSWIILDDLIEHAQLAEHITVQACSAFSPDYIYDRVKVIELVETVEKLESDADILKRKIRKSLMSSIRPSADSTLFLEILRVNDYIAGRAVIAVTKLQYIPISVVPDPVREGLSLMGENLPRIMRELVNSLEFLEEKIYLAVKGVKSIQRLESEFDRYYSNLLNSLYKNENNFELKGRFTIMTTIKECAEAMEDGADNIEHSADLISILGEKYRP